MHYWNICESIFLQSISIHAKLKSSELQLQLIAYTKQTDDLESINSSQHIFDQSKLCRYWKLGYIYGSHFYALYKKEKVSGIDFSCRSCWRRSKYSFRIIPALPGIVALKREEGGTGWCVSTSSSSQSCVYLSRRAEECECVSGWWRWWRQSSRISGDWRNLRQTFAGSQVNVTFWIH